MLRLRAVDAEDLAVIASCLQDALVLVQDMAYLEDQGQFVLVANRFCWETADPAGQSFCRTTTGVTFDGVTRVTRRKIDRRRHDSIVSLLTIRPVEGGIELTFANGCAVRLETAEISVRLEDFGEVWPTRWCPRHEA